MISGLSCLGLFRESLWAVIEAGADLLDRLGLIIKISHHFYRWRLCRVCCMYLAIIVRPTDPDRSRGGYRPLLTDSYLASFVVALIEVA
jgi:hypothetical protein